MEKIEIGYESKKEIATLLGYCAVAEYPSSAEKSLELIYHLMNLIGQDKLKEVWQERYVKEIDFLKKQRNKLAETLSYYAGLSSGKITDHTAKNKKFQKFLKNNKRLVVNPRINKIRQDLLNMVDISGVNISEAIIMSLKRKKTEDEPIKR